MARAKTKTTRSALTYETLPALFTGICDAIRAKNGTSAEINHQDIPSAIAAITTGIDLTTLTSGIGRTITGEGSLSVTNGQRYLVFSMTYDGTTANITFKLTQGGANQTPIATFVTSNTAIRFNIYDVVAKSNNFYLNRSGSATTYFVAVPIS